MDVKKQLNKVARLMVRHPRRTVTLVLVLLILVADAAVFYHVGNNNSSSDPSVTLTTPTTQPKPVKGSEEAPFGLNNTAGSVIGRGCIGLCDSGFFQLNGVVQSNKKNELLVKLSSGSTISLSVSSEAKYHATTRALLPISKLNGGTKVLITGSVGSTGIFTASNIQATNLNVQ